MLARLLSPPGLRGGPSPLTPQASRGNLRWSLGRMLVALQDQMLVVLQGQVLVALQDQVLVVLQSQMLGIVRAQMR